MANCEAICIYTVYCLHLDGDHYYVGKTKDLQRRVSEHASGRGSAWTKLHHVIGLDEKWENCDEFDEDKYLKMTMRKYGIDKVRGGSYVQCELSIEQRNTLQRELHGATNACFKCGSADHWARDCPNPIDTAGKSRIPRTVASRQQAAQTESAPFTVMGALGSGLIALGKMMLQKGDPAPAAEIICFKCGKTGHVKPNCPVRIDVTCYTCGKSGHMSPACGLASRG